MRLDIFCILELDPKIFNNNKLYIKYLFKVREIAASNNIATNFGSNMCGLHKNYTFKFKKYFQNPLFFEIVDNPLSLSAENFFNTSKFKIFTENMGNFELFISEILDFSSRLILMINSYEQKDFNKLNSITIDVKNFVQKLLSVTKEKEPLIPTLKLIVTKDDK